MATTIIILTPARLTATTDLTGLQVECLSAPAHGMAGVAVGVGGAGAGAAGAGAAAVGVDVGSSAAAGLQAAADLHTVVRASVAALVDFMEARQVEGSTVAAGFIAEAASTVAEVEDSMAAVDTLVVADTAADTDKFVRSLI